MSTTRVCSSCKWEYPVTYTKTKCRFCGARFDTQVCLECNTLVPTELFNTYKSGRNAGHLRRICKPCDAGLKKAHDEAHPEQAVIRNQRFISQRRAMAEMLFNTWLDMTDLPFKPLSEQQWLKACSYFGGCAVCGAEHIETRQFFMQPRKTNRKVYTPFNVFPMCGTCSTYTRHVINPFVWLDKNIGTSNKLGMTDERRERMLEYFILQIEEIANEPKN